MLGLFRTGTLPMRHRAGRQPSSVAFEWMLSLSKLLCLMFDGADWLVGAAQVLVGPLWFGPNLILAVAVLPAQKPSGGTDARRRRNEAVACMLFASSSRVLGHPLIAPGRHERCPGQSWDESHQHAKRRPHMPVRTSGAP